MSLRERWTAVPLRTRLVLLFVVLLSVGLTTAGVTTATLLRGYLLQQTDEQIAVAARNLDAQTLEQLAAGGSIGMPSDYYVRLQSATGDTFHIAAGWTVQTFGTPELPQVQPEPGTGYTVGTERPGQRWRAITYAIQGAPGSTMTVALPLTGPDETLSQVVVAIAVTGVCVVLVGAVTGWAAVRRALRPLRQIEQTAGAIAAGDLSRRVPEASPATEVGSLALSLNAMLTHIERAFAAQAASEGRMRRFVSDASHELRTPLATVRGYGELYRMGAIPDDELATAMGRIESEARRMGDLVTDLLQLARLDEGRAPAREPVDLTVLATDALTDLRALDPQRPTALLTVPGAVPGPGAATVVVGDEDALRQVLSNLVGNVVRYTPAGSPAELALGRVGEEVVLELRDHGPGIAPEHAERVFERFYRLDDSRTRASGGSGLGLAIVAAVVAAHGGTVRVVPTPGGGTTVRLTLPAAPVPSEPTTTPR